MADFFGNLRSGVQFPQVVMNQGPLPGSGGLPRPLHDTADARINYNSTLLGNLNPYAYGEPGYLSSQTAYLNIPHKLQKFVPVVYLPEAKKGATDFFDLSHAVDDGDLVFTLRLARNSLFCTGSRHGDTRRTGLGTRADPLINLATVNYILSGVQIGVTDGNPAGDLWSELLFNLDPSRFGKRTGVSGRDYRSDPLILSDLVHIVRNCIRPIGIARGSENQGGQNEVTMGAATWPVGFVISVTLDGKESNVLNLWHHADLSAGDDLVLALKLMPLRPYTLNHYFEGFKRQNWALGGGVDEERYVWQLVPAIAHLDPPTKTEADLAKRRIAVVDKNMLKLGPFRGRDRPSVRGLCSQVDEHTPWQELGYWHIGRTQIMTARYGVEEYWHNDQANSLRTNHLDITLQPYFARPPRGQAQIRAAARAAARAPQRSQMATGLADVGERRWKASLQLERLPAPSEPCPPPVRAAPSAAAEPDAANPAVAHGWMGDLLGLGAADEDIGILEDAAPLTQAPAEAEPIQEPASEAGAGPGRGRSTKRQATGKGVKANVVGSLLRPDGTSESCMVNML